MGYGLLRILSSDTNGEAALSFKSADDGDTDPGHWIIGKNTAGDSADQFSIWNQSANRLTIDTSGNVGIGNTTPVYNLDVVGDINFTGNLRQNGVPLSGGSSQWITTGSDIYFDAGNVGIGTTNPYAVKLHVDAANAGGLGGSIFLTNTGSPTNGSFSRLGFDLMHFDNTTPTASIDGYLADSSNGATDLVFNAYDGSGSVTNYERMRILGVSGNVGIGTVSPLAKFQVAQDVPDTTGYAQIEAIGGSDNAKRLMVGFDTTNDKGFIQATISGVGLNDLLLNPRGGNVSVNNTSPSYTLDVTGDINYSGGIYNTSDIRLKHDIAGLDSSLASVLALNPVSFRYNTDTPDSVLRYGFVAQEVEALYPDFVSTDNQGFLHVNYMNFTPVIVKAIQDMNLSVNALKDRVVTVENRLTAIESIIAVGGLATSSSATSTVSASSTVETVSGWLSSLGVVIENAVARFVAIVADMITAKKLTVGDSSNLAASGITILDRQTGAPVCMFVEGGVMKSQVGACGEGATSNNQGGGTGGGNSGGSTGGDTGGGDSGSGDTGTTTPDGGDQGGSTGGDTGGGDTGSGDTGTTTPDGGDQGSSTGADTGGDSGTVTPETP